MQSPSSFGNFQFTSVSGTIDPLGLLSYLVGEWRGTGFNQIWRPFSQPGQDRFLELNETLETLTFIAIPGDIPNRGLLQPDINLRGLHYTQIIQDAHVYGPNMQPAGIHFEPDLWLNIPTTTNPAEPSTVARLASIPHGTGFVAQGTADVFSGPPIFPSTNIDPFPIGQPANHGPFPEQDLATATQFRTLTANIPNVTQSLIDDPNSFLAQGIAGKTIDATVLLEISTMVTGPITAGGGIADIAFLAGAAGGPNALAARVDAIFWIERIEPVTAGGPQQFQLQYSQKVLLNFNNLSWPHVSVATLEKQVNDQS